MRIGVIAIFIIDRFEGDWAVVEFKGKTFNVPKVLFPQQVREGDVVRIAVDVDEQGTKERKKIVMKLADELFED